jgi:hypothetical protein
MATMPTSTPSVPRLPARRRNTGLTPSKAPTSSAASKIRWSGQAYVNSTTAWRDISAYAGKVRINYLFKDQMQNQVSLVGEFLSGDDPNTKGKDEMFDVLWGRWPRWTELGTWCYATETGGKYLQMNNTWPGWTQLEYHSGKGNEL